MACNRVYVLHHYESQSISLDTLANIKADSSILAFIEPYQIKLNQKMDSLVVYSEKAMQKQKPESELGNLMADLMLEKGEHLYGKKIDFSLMNYGGIRSVLPKGAITLGKIYELMPFDNQLVVLTLDGKTTQELLNHWAKKGGTPMAGVRFEIDSLRKATNVFFRDKKFDLNNNYTLVLTDYIAKGGDQCSFLENALKYEELNVLYRDVIIQYFQEIHKKKQSLNPMLDGRIKYQK